MVRAPLARAAIRAAILAALLPALAGCRGSAATIATPGTTPATAAASASARAATSPGSTRSPAAHAPVGATRTVPTSCAPNREYPLGDEYRPDAPERARVGSGYVLSGTVRAATGCGPIPGARVELWLASLQGVYDDTSRATVVADAAGGYRFESHVPVPYSGAQPHIHIRATAPGFRPLVTIHPHVAGQHSATFDLVLTPER
jgi:protocatechuate 3,4-dioxygenase beta subunit